MTRVLAMVLVLASLAVMAVPAAAATVALPIEVMGPAGTEVSVVVDIPQGSTAQTLRLKVHGLTYQEKASVRVGSGAWIDLRNSNADVTVAQPGKKYGGIGGGFQVLSLDVKLASGSLVNGANTIRFRFNSSDGRSMGYRVLALGALNASGTDLIPADRFQQTDPSTWQPPRTAQADIDAGDALWSSAVLINAPGGSAIKATCAMCHDDSGRDLKYFNYSNHSIIERARFHGLSQTQGEQIASYVRTRNVVNPGRPWNPPFQPGPGLDAKPSIEWAAGAGVEWAVENDATLAAYVPAGDRSALAGVYDDQRRIGGINHREIPVPIQFLDWNHWLPEIHPIDAAGESAWNASVMKTKYDEIRPGLAGTPDQSSARYIRVRLRDDLNTWAGPDNGSAPPIPDVVDGTAKTQRAYTAQQSAILWQLVQYWSMDLDYGLRDLGEQFYGIQGEPRQWLLNRTVFNPTPHIIHHAQNLSLLFDSTHGPFTQDQADPDWGYTTDNWYQMQVLLNPSARKSVTGGHHTVDWAYVRYFLGTGQKPAAEARRQALMGVRMAWKSLEQNVDVGWGPASFDGKGEAGSINPGDSPWWSVDLAQTGNALGHLYESGWDGISNTDQQNVLRPYLIMYIEKISAFRRSEWNQQWPGPNKSWSDDVGNFNVINEARQMILLMRDRAQVEDALVNAYADWGALIFPNNDWNGLKRTVSTAIPAPTGVTATAQAGRVSVTWSPVSGATSYNVFRQYQGEPVAVAAGLLVEGTTFTDPLLEPGATVAYSVSANKDRALGPVSAGATATVGTGLVLRWTFDESTGNVTDQSGHGSWAKPIAGAERVTGKIGKAISFEGGSEERSPFLGSSQNLGRWLGGSSTVTFWVKTTASGKSDVKIDAPALLGSTQDFAGSGSFVLGALTNTGRLGATFWGGNVVTSTQSINNGAWQHVAISRDAATGTIAYTINGVAAGSGTSASGVKVARTFSLGRVDAQRGNWWEVYRYFPGAIDDLRIYNKVLSLAEIQAVYTDTSGGGGGGNAAPSVTITEPANGANLIAPATLRIRATASDSDGTVTKVEFFAGATKLGEDTTSPYEYTWTTPPVGSQQLLARATDNLGATKDSAPVTLTLTAPVPNVGTGDGWLGRYFPNKTLTEPAAFERRDATLDFDWGSGSPDPRLANDGFSVRWTGSLLAQYSETYTFTATTDDGVRVWVGGELLVDSFINQGPTPRSGTKALVAGQSYPVKVEYFENAGGASARLQWSSPSTPAAIIPATQVTAPAPEGANAAPTVTITAPTSGTSLAAPAVITLSATAADSDGTVAKVAFYAGSTKLGEDTSSPFSLEWNAPPVGVHQLTAVATDNLGASTTSAAVTITITAGGSTGTNAPPAAAITSPADKASMTLPGSVAITASASDSDGSVVKVEFFSGSTKLGEATVAPYTFTWSEPPAGDHQLHVTATDDGGAVTTSAVVALKVAAAPNPNGPTTPTAGQDSGSSGGGGCGLGSGLGVLGALLALVRFGLRSARHGRA